MCSRQIAKIVNKHFTSVGKRVTISFSGVKSLSASFISDVAVEFKPVTVASVAKQFATAAGLDNMSAHMLRDSSNMIAPPLSYLINMSPQAETFLDTW